jgi:hypothetical protein
MSNITITNNDIGGVVLFEPQYQDDTLNFAADDTVLEGTILARDSVSKKLIPFVKGGSTNENGIPKAVLSYEVTAEEDDDVSVRVIVSGTLHLAKMVIHADGDNTNIDAVVKDQLRSYGIVAASSVELNDLDNQ